MHSIRLTDAWERDAGDRWRRRFHWVAKLGRGDRVWLKFYAVDFRLNVVLNNQPLDQVSSDLGECRFDVTEHLLPTNDLMVELDVDADAAAQEVTPFGEAKLVIDAVAL